MSGIEIVGLVLGSIPLLISALDHYGNGVRTIVRWWDYHRELRSIRRLLMAEYHVFRSTVERLLEGLLPGPVLDDLMNSTMLEDWRDKDILAVDRKLKARLSSSYSSFMMCVEDISTVIIKLNQDLEVTASSKVCIYIPHTIIMPSNLTVLV